MSICAYLNYHLRLSHCLSHYTSLFSLLLPGLPAPKMTLHIRSHRPSTRSPLGASVWFGFLFSCALTSVAQILLLSWAQHPGHLVPWTCQPHSTSTCCSFAWHASLPDTHITPFLFSFRLLDVTQNTCLLMCTVSTYHLLFLHTILTQMTPTRKRSKISLLFTS